MSSSELRYLIAANELAEQIECVKQTDVANRLRVSKGSTYNAMERLRDKGYIEKSERKIVLTALGKEVLHEYMTIIRFMSAHLSLHCGTAENQAYPFMKNVALYARIPCQISLLIIMITRYMSVVYTL